MKFRLRRLFDSKFYLEQNRDLRELNIDPLQHYCERGHRENRDPHPIFDLQFYRTNFMVPGQTENPLLHYLRQAESLANTHPLFDARFYATSAIEKFKELGRGALPKNKSLLEHFLENKTAPAASPSVFFDAESYLNANSEIKKSGMNALYHFLRFGINEGRSHFFNRAAIHRLRYLPDVLLNPAVGLLGQHARFVIDVLRTNQNLPNVLFAVNEADETPDAMRAFNIARRIIQNWKCNVVFLLAHFGKLRAQFLSVGPTYCLHGASEQKSKPEFERKLNEFGWMIEHAAPSIVFTNDILADDVLGQLQRFEVPVVSLNHRLIGEFPTQQLTAVAERCDQIVFPSHFARQRALENTVLDPKQLSVVVPGFESPAPEAEIETRPAKRFVVVGAGDYSHASGFDLFLSIALTTLSIESDKRLSFVWHGSSVETNAELLALARSDVEKAGATQRIAFVETNHSESTFKDCDVFLLTTRGEAFSDAALAAMAHGKPVILFKNVSGNVSSICGSKGGAVIPFGDVATAVDQILCFHAEPELVSSVGRRNKNVVRDDFDFGKYVHSFLPSGSAPASVVAKRNSGRRVVFSSPSWEVSGVNTFTELLITQLNQRGFDASILFTTKVPARLTDSQLPKVPYQYVSNLTLEEPERRKAVLDYLRVQGDAIFVPNFDYVASTVSSQLPANVRTVGILHSDDDEHYLHAHRMGAYWDKVVVVSERIDARLQNLNPIFKEKTQLIRYGIEIGDLPQDSIDSLSIDSRHAVPELRIVYTGRIQQAQKRIFSFVELADELVLRDVPFQLTLIGDGDDLEELKLRFRKHIELGRVRLPGRLTSAQLKKQLLEQHAFCLMSDFEGLPLSMLEAMACNCVPVVPNIESGISEILEHDGSALISPKGDVYRMADNLQRLHSDLELRNRLANGARATLRKFNLSVPQMADLYEGLFAEIFDAIELSMDARMRLPLNSPEVAQMLNAA